jgi:hypothetical protein
MGAGVEAVTGLSTAAGVTGVVGAVGIVVGAVGIIDAGSVVSACV